MSEIKIGGNEIGASGQIGHQFRHRRIHPERVIQAHQRQHPHFAGGDGAAQFNQHALGRRAHLIFVGLAEVGVRVEGVVRVVGAGVGRHRIDDHVGIGPAGQHHHVFVGDRRIVQAGAAVGRGVLRQQRRDLILAGRIRHHTPDAVGAQDELLVLGAIAFDDRGLSGAGALDDGQVLADQLDLVLVDRMTRQRDHQVVAERRVYDAGIDCRLVGNAGEDVEPLLHMHPGDPHLVGAG